MSKSHERHLRMIKETIEVVAGRLYGNKEQAIAETYTELLKHAVRIQDEGERNAFTSLIGKWFYVANLQEKMAKVCEK